MVFSRSDVGQMAALGDVAGLVKVLKQGNPKVRRDAAAALRVLRDQAKGQSTPIGTTPQDNESSTTTSIHGASERTSNHHAITVLLHLLFDTSPAVRAQAITALRNLDDPKVMDYLFRAYHNGDRERRKQIAIALSGLADEQTILERLRRYKG